MRNIALLIIASIFFAVTISSAKQVAFNHPFLGTWNMTFTLPGGSSCDEIYSVRSDGTTWARSAEEVSESDYEISDEPNENGFYRWTDTVTKTNGKPDCSGSATPIGDVATNYVIFHPSGNMFL